MKETLQPAVFEACMIQKDYQGEEYHTNHHLEQLPGEWNKTMEKNMVSMNNIYNVYNVYNSNKICNLCWIDNVHNSENNEHISSSKSLKMLMR